MASLKSVLTKIKESVGIGPEAHGGIYNAIDQHVTQPLQTALGGNLPAVRQPVVTSVNAPNHQAAQVTPYSQTLPGRIQGPEMSLYNNFAYPMTLGASTLPIGIASIVKPSAGTIYEKNLKEVLSRVSAKAAVPKQVPLLGGKPYALLAGQIAGDPLTPLVGGGESLLTRTGIQAAGGAGIGALQPAENLKQRAEQAFTGAILGGGFSVAHDFANNIVNSADNLLHPNHVVPDNAVRLNKDIPSVNPEQYVQEQKQAQQAAGRAEDPSFGKRIQSGVADLKRKLVDSAAPIEDTLFKAQKQGNFEVLPGKNISNQIDRVYRAPVLASQFAKDNGIVDVIKDVPNIDAFNQYLIARHAPDVEAAGFKTGRNLSKDSEFVRQLAPIYEPYAQKVGQYGQKLLDYATQTGLVSPETAAQLKTQYPNYVPLNRVFNELEQSGISSGVSSRPVASLSKQNVVQGLQGSERAIKDPIESLLAKTHDAFMQGERNQAGQMLASYKDLPGFQGLIRPLEPGASAPHTFSYLQNGVKQTFETTPEIAQAAKLLDKQQLGLVGKIFAFPVRLARIGITGVNVPFIAGNIVKDQASAFINSNRALQTSVANPRVFVSALWNAVGHGAEYENWIRNAAGGTSFDLSRGAAGQTLGKLRAQRSAVSNVAYTVTHPSQLLHTVEDIIGRSEELTRLQQFIGTRDSLIKEGRSAQDANILAAKQSREATTNFARSGDWGQALNSVFLYLNSGIQGSRTLVRNLAERPAQTTAKLATAVFFPIAAVTAWNTSDPARKQAYDDIQEYEKDGNMIIVPPNPTKDPKTGKWNVIKIPFSAEIANLTVPVRKTIEAAVSDGNAPGTMDVVKALIGSSTGLNVQSQQQLVGQFTPQAIKPTLEATLNKNLFTGNDIVPQYLNGYPTKDLPPDMQVRDNTSGTARIAGGLLNTSPLKVEQFVKSSLGGVGSQLLNASDRALASGGVIPQDQIGGQSITDGIKSRFSQASGGQQLSNLFDNKPVKGAQTSGGSSAQTSQTPGVVENNGTYYVRVGNNKIKSFDNPDDAKLELAKDKFSKSNEKSLTLGDVFLYKGKDGKVKVDSVTDRQAKIDAAQATLDLQQYKDQNNLKGYLNTLESQWNTLQQRKTALDPQIDQASLIDLTNKQQDIAKQFVKYRDYGGFTKPKKAKKIRIKKFAAPKGNVARFAAPKARVTKIKLPSQVKVAKIRLKKGH